MKPILYDKTGKTQLGVLEHCINCFTEEERNGGFTLTLTYPITDELHKDLIYDNIIVVKANDEYDNQQFRIATTERIIKGTVTVKAVHISYDLVYDLVQNVSFEKESCEYALNQLFKNSHFSKHYKGYSNITNPQKYSVVNKNIWEAIVGSTGSIIDTYGKGPEIIRDNTNIHVLNKRGTDRGVVIEYSVNMLDEALEIDASTIITCIYGFARYTDEENNEHIVNAPKVESVLIDSYAHPFIVSKDYTDRFEQGTVPTEKQITSLVEADFDTGIDQPKCNYTINFVPLSKCSGYENIQDDIHLCDTVTIKDKRYNINAKAAVISYKYNVLLERYDSMELGDAKLTLSDTIVGGAKKDLEDKIDNMVIIGNKNYPDTLPGRSVITLCAGLGSIQIDWTYEKQPYYTYELYGSTQQGFTPAAIDLLYEGQGSSFNHTVAPATTWYYKVRAKNTYNRYNEFSDEASITSGIIEEDTVYIKKGSIDDAYIGTLKLDRGWVGQLSGERIDARNLTVTNEDGVKTLEVDGSGNVIINASNIDMNIEAVQDELTKLSSKIEMTEESILLEVEKKVDSDSIISSINLTPEEIQIQAEKIDMTGNLDLNGTFICYGDAENQSGNYLYQADAIHRGYLAGSDNPTFSSGIWRPDGVNDVGYVSVGLTNSDHIDENGCLWISPESTGATHLYYSKLENGRGVYSGIKYDIDGTANYYSFMPNRTNNNYYSHIFDGGISTHSIYGSSLTCGAIGCTGNGTFNGSLTVNDYAYLNSNVRVNNQIYTTNSNLWLGAGGLNAKYMLTLQSDGYLLPKDAVQLGKSDAPFYQLVCTYAPSIVSDERKKENIQYIVSSTTPAVLSLDNEDSNNADITIDDMYEHVKELPLATYDIKNSKEDSKKQIGFIAQDIQGTKVGDYIIDDRDENNLSYDMANRISVLEGALKKAIEKIECLQSIIDELGGE